MSRQTSNGARTRARELLVQALYQHQLAGHEAAELLEQFHEQAAYERVDQGFFNGALPAILGMRRELETLMTAAVDRPLERLDPVEFAILLLGFYELKQCIDVPYRVVINESVNLARRFGAAESHRYVNACLDTGARSLRAVEVKVRG